jgi:hypothetical protein
MAIRTTRKKVTFKKPFILKGIDGVNRSGIYSVETRVDHVGFFSFRKAGRTTTWIRICRTPGVRGVLQVVNIDPADLSAALLLDSEGRAA